jgi:ABC-type transport system substrate-binding protein
MTTDGPKSLDPADGSTVYDNRCSSMVYETLLQYKYLVRPLALEPLLLTEMPAVSDDGLTYRFKLKPGIFFHDDPCFEGGKGREMVASDVIYSWKRIADNDVSLKNWWLMQDTIVGLDEYRQQQNEADQFDYDADVEGFKILNDHEFEVVLQNRVQRFMWTLAMFQFSVVPREAVEEYGSNFGYHPVGNGPYLMAEDDFVPGKSIIFTKNPNYHECYYPEDHGSEDEEFGFHEAVGTRLPIVDRVEFTFFVDSQPMWLQFRSDNLDYTTVPAENYLEAFNKRSKKIKPVLKKEGITGHHVPLLDFIFFGFNMEDEVLGGYNDEQKYLRQAISLALDWHERNDAFYNSTCIVYDGMIPPGLVGYPKDGKGPVSYLGPDIQRAKELLKKAGHPNGDGLPTIVYYTARGANSQQQTEMTARQLKKIGININPRLEDFSTFTETVNNKKAPMFSYAWSSDYPDGENNLQLFYGPNESPGSNSFNYKNDKFDEMYEQILVMPPSEQRTEMFEKMRDMVIEDCAYMGSMARTRSYLVSPRLKNFKPTEGFYNWVKYLDIDESAKAQ